MLHYKYKKCASFRLLCNLCDGGITCLSSGDCLFACAILRLLADRTDVVFNQMIFVRMVPITLDIHFYTSKYDRMIWQNRKLSIKKNYFVLGNKIYLSIQFRNRASIGGAWACLLVPFNGCFDTVKCKHFIIHSNRDFINKVSSNIFPCLNTR